MKKTAILLCAVAASVTLAAQQPDRKQPPPIGPAPSLKLPAIQKHKLSNGLAVWIVEHHEVPLAQINLIVRSGSAADPIGKYGVGSLTAAMLDEGAGTRSSLELADAIEFLGANLSTSSSFDASSIRMSVPVSRLAEALPLMSDVALRPTFPSTDLDRLRKETATAREMTRALNQTEASFYRNMERVGGFGGKADQLNAYFKSAGTPDFFDRDLARYRAVTAAEVQAAVDRYLPKDRRVELSVIPGDKK